MTLLRTETQNLSHTDSGKDRVYPCQTEGPVLFCLFTPANDIPRVIGGTSENSFPRA